jgi:hypothetical protein
VGVYQSSTSGVAVQVRKQQPSPTTAILNGEPWAIALALKTLGKSRGYVERAELAGAADAPPVPITFVEVGSTAERAQRNGEADED